MQRRFEVGGQEFRYTPPGMTRIDPEPGDQSMFVFKSAEMIAQYRAWAERFRGGRLVELGIYDGGSTALLAKLFEPQRLASFDIKDDVPELTRFIAINGLGGRVFANFGHDQADVDTLEATLEAQMGPEPLDLVIDDASHLYAESKASFSSLFPRLRPGGLYVLEDWSHDHRRSAAMHQMIQADPDGAVSSAVTAALHESGFQDGVSPVTTMARLVLELMLVAAVRPDLVATIRIDQDFAEIERGTADIAGRLVVDDHLAPLPMLLDLRDEAASSQVS